MVRRGMGANGPSSLTRNPKRKRGITMNKDLEDAVDAMLGQAERDGVKVTRGEAESVVQAYDTRYHEAWDECYGQEYSAAYVACLGDGMNAEQAATCAKESADESADEYASERAREHADDVQTNFS